MGLFNKSPKEQELYIYERFRNQANVKWCNIEGEQTGEAFYQANRYLILDLRNLRICHHCFALYGIVRLKDGKKVYQNCMCDELDKPRWDKYDFNRKYELCWCCGLEVIPSGSKFSSFYCRDCKERIWYLNQKLGRCLIPLGRHSVMNGVIGTGKDVGNIYAIAMFCHDIGTVNEKIDFLHDEYMRKKIKDVVDVLQLSKDSRAIGLLKKTKDVDIARLKEEAFLDLLIEVFVRFIPLHKLSLN